MKTGLTKLQFQLDWNLPTVHMTSGQNDHHGNAGVKKWPSPVMTDVLTFYMNVSSIKRLKSSEGLQCISSVLHPTTDSLRLFINNSQIWFRVTFLATKSFGIRHGD